MSRNTHFVCYFWAKEKSSVLFFTRFPSLNNRFSLLTLDCVFLREGFNNPSHGNFPWRGVGIRAGPQNEKWSDRQKTENPTGSIHKEARKKSLTQKKLILMRGFAFEKYGPCSKNAQRKWGKNIKKQAKWQKITFGGLILVTKVSS